MEKLNHRIWLLPLGEIRQLLSVKRNAYGDILFELDGGLTRQFTPEGEVPDFELERVQSLGRCTLAPGWPSHLILQNPEAHFTVSSIRDYQTPPPEEAGAKPKKIKTPVKIVYNSTQKTEVITKWKSYKKASGKTRPPIDGFYHTIKKHFETLNISEAMARQIIKNENVSKCKQNKKERATKRGDFHDPVLNGR
jgi:hypothetical protein